MGYYACDLETTGLKFQEDKILCFGYWSPNDKGCLTSTEEITTWLERHSNDCLIWHNGKFDQKFIRKHCGRDARNDFDTMLAASLLPEKPDSLGLGALVEHFLGLPSWKEKAFRGNMSAQELENVKDYCLTDCEYTYKIAQIETELLISSGNFEFFKKYFMPVSNMLMDIEYVGVKINTDLLEEEWQYCIKDIAEFEEYLREKYKPLISEYEDARIDEHIAKHPKGKRTREELRQHKNFKFNFTSPKQRLWLLKDKLGFSCQMESYSNGKKKVTLSTKSEVIEDYLGQHEIIEDLLHYSDVINQEKYLHLYKENLSKDGRIHTKFNLDVARTGRLSSSEPPLQNVKRDE